MQNGEHKISPEAQKLLEDLTKARRAKTEPIVLKVLQNLLDLNLPLFDTYYIESRTKELFEKTCEVMNFDIPGVAEKMQEVVDLLVDKAIKKLPAEKKHKGTDLTSIRNKKCEPVCHEIMGIILDKELVKDKSFFEKLIKEEVENIFRVVVSGYLNTFFERVQFSVGESFLIAQENAMGNRKERITFQEIEKLLKKNKKD